MSRSTVPRIAPTDLRDHADPARIERIWERIDGNLPAPEASSRRRSGLVLAAIAATFAAFAGGIFVGKSAFRRPVERLVLQAPNDQTPVDILAAGEEGRSFSLGGGNEIKLKPGTTVEVIRTGADTVMLKLVQGEATVDTHVQSVAIVAGEAKLATQAGSSVTVSRRLGNMDVDVSSGSVDLQSPMLSRSLAKGENASFPIHRPTASLVPTADVEARPHAAPPRPHEPPAAEPVAVATPSGEDWLSGANKLDYPTALDRLRAQPGGIDAAISKASTAEQLYKIHEVLKFKGADPDASARALVLLADKFPNDQYAILAANKLCAEYAKTSASRAEPYCNAAAQNPNWAESAACNMMRAKASTQKDDAIRLAKEYLEKHPTGQCSSEAKRLADGDDDGDEPAEVPKPESKPEKKDTKAP